MNAKKALERTLHQLANKLMQEEEKVFSSEKIEKYLNALAASVIGDNCSVPAVQVYYDTFSHEIASTDSHAIRINITSDIISFFAAPEDKFIAIVGLLYHELAHCLYTDFDTAIKAAEEISRGKPYGQMPKKPADDAREAEEAFGRYPLFFGNLCRELDNIAADVHDENAIIADYGEFAEVSILKVRESLRRHSLTYEDMEEAYRNGEATMLRNVIAVMFEYARFERIVAKDEDAFIASEYWKRFCCVSGDIEALCREDNADKRYELINRIIVKLWPVIKEEIEHLENQAAQNQNSQNSQSSQNGNTSPQTSDSQIDSELASQLQSAAEAVQQGEAPKGRANSEAVKNPQNVNPQQAKKSAGEAESEIGRLLREAAREKAGEQLESSHRKDMVRLSRDISQNSCHRGVHLCMRTEPHSDKQRYDDIRSEVRQYVKVLGRRIKEALKDIQIGENKRHRIFGREIDVRDVYRPDSLFFSQKKLPGDMPDMAIGILVDNSGSMSGERLNAAVKACIMLYELGRELGVSTGVFGHSTCGSSVELRRFCEFDEYSAEQRYRIPLMDACGCNRDGYAVLTAGSELALRDEPLKLLFVISDGQPNHDEYAGEAAEEDIRQICADLKKRGVSVIGCAIGDDRSQIERIYRDRCLDISDLSLLPKTLTKLVQRKILSEL